jgi:signal peptide peptidase SppA
MDRLFSSASTLWAMHPDFLSALLKQGSIEAILPDALKNLASMMSGSTAAAKPADPIREGSTAIVPVRGLLGPSSMGRFQTPTDVLANRMRELAADPKVGAIVLDIASPGGYVYGTAEAGDAIFEARQAKPVIAVASPFSFSAAHWLATQASTFLASPSADVGSVGVRSGHVDMSGFEDKIGMKTTLIASDPDKIAGHPYAPLTEEDRQTIEADVAESNQAFIAAIARGRGIAAGEVPGIHGKGATFSAKRAAELGITDGVMTLRDAVAKYGSSRARLGLMRRQAALVEQSIGI